MGREVLQKYYAEDLASTENFKDVGVGGVMVKLTLSKQDVRGCTITK